MRIFGWLTGGLGASGALVAVAAALLLALSAAVAFHGWPDRLVPGGAGATPIEIAVAKPSAQDRPTRTLPAVPRALRGAAHGAPRRTGAARGGARTGSGRRSGSTSPRHRSPSRRPVARRPGAISVPSTSGTRTTSGSTPAADSGSAPTASSGGTRTPTVTTPGGQTLPSVPPASQAPTKVGQAVEDTTQQVGDTVKGASDDAAGAVRPVSPPAAQTVQDAGAAVDQAVQDVGQVVGGIVTGLATATKSANDRRPGLGLGRPAGR